MTQKERTQALDAAKRASARTAKLVHYDMQRGLSSVASVAASAFFVGILGTLLGIVESFTGGDGSKSYFLALITDLLSQSLFPTAVGLFVALTAFCGYQYFTTKLEGFDVEMENATLNLLNQLRSTNI